MPPSPRGRAPHQGGRRGGGCGAAGHAGAAQALGAVLCAGERGGLCTGARGEAGADRAGALLGGEDALVAFSGLTEGLEDGRLAASLADEPRDEVKRL